MNDPGTAKLTLRKDEKLRTKAEFDQVRRDGRKYVGHGFLLVSAPAPDGKLKCGVICSRRYSKLAVRRNRARRLLFEAFRLLKPECKAIRMILIPRMGMQKYALAETLAEMRKLMQQAEVVLSPSPELSISR